MINLTCIRHTKVDVPAGICYGQTDVPVAASYPEEMAGIAGVLKPQAFDRIYASPLTRCRRLALDLLPGGRSFSTIV